MNKDCYCKYISILNEELILATGCTEPIAVAFCAAKMKESLGCIPDRVKVEVSGNIIKNTKSVVVPNTGSLRGIGAAVAAGIIAGNSDRELQVIADISPVQQETIREYLNKLNIEILCKETDIPLDIQITGSKGNDSATVRIANNHTNIVFISKNGKELFSQAVSHNTEQNLTDKTILNIKDIVEFADTVSIDEVKDVILRQIECNIAIAEEGIKNSWGANVGSSLLSSGDDIRTLARAYAAAGSDARMSGCEMPVVIVSGSGNQGITASVPVACYARYLGVSEEKMVRAVLLSDLVTIHQKTGIGRLSAYCGAVSAGCGAGAGIAYLYNEDCEIISETVSNAVAILSGTICDGAKSSCAAKIACGVEAGILGYTMAKNGQHFQGGEGIVSDNVESTIRNVGRLASEGMKQTDRTILSIMTE